MPSDDPYFDPASPEGEAILRASASPHSWQGWCRDVVQVWRVPRLLDSRGRMARMTRKDFHSLPTQRLQQLRWAEVDVLCPPWGCFYGESPSGDWERDRELRAEVYAGWDSEG